MVVGKESKQASDEENDAEWEKMNAERIKKNKKKKCGPCDPLRKCFISLFNKAYPSQVKATFNTEGEWLRRLLLISTILHVFFFVFSLAIVGFKTMLDNLLLACWSLSIYYTL